MIESNAEIEILRSLHEQNPWWTENSLSKKYAKPFKPETFYNIKKELEKKEIIALTGQRQVGKTTIMYQLIDHLIKQKKLDSKHTLYFSFDNPFAGVIQIKESNLMNTVLDTYSINILKESFSTIQKPVYIFFDEITKYDTWSEVLKGWYDLKYPIHFFISDSSSANLLKGSSESLVGRIRIHTLLSFKFRDFVNYKRHKKTDHKPTSSNRVSSSYKKMFYDSLTQHHPSQLYETIKQCYASFAKNENELKMYSKEYMMKDGFPELITMDIDDCRKKLYDYISLMLQKDLLRLFEIRNPKALEQLITFVAAESTQLFSYENISQTLKITDDTVKEYLDYLNTVFLISKAPFYSESNAKQLRKQQKIYLNNVGLRNVLIQRMNEHLFLDGQELGKIAELLVHNHVKRLFFTDERKATIYYWRDKKGKEVDVVVKTQNKPIPIEVKFKNMISSTDLKGIKTFLSTYSSPFGIIVTKDLIDKKDKLIFIPLWMFLLLC